jgi:hypothetical protein
MSKNPKLDKIIRYIVLKENEVLEIRTEKENYNLYYRFTAKPISKISKITVYSEKDLIN